MANTKRRTNISLDTKLFKEATAYGKENGRSLSSLIEQGLRAVLDGPPVMAEHAHLAPLPDLEALAGARIEETMPQLLMAWLESARGAERLERILVPYVNERVAMLKGRAAAPVTSTGTGKPPKPPTAARSSTVDVPEEVRERLARFSIAQLTEASGLPYGSVAQIRRGDRSRIRVEKYEKILRGLDTLEAQERE